MSCISMHCLLGAFILGAALAAGPSETTLTAKVGEDITLDTGTSELHDDPDIYWTYGPNQNIIVHYENGEINLKKSDRFELDERTGSLTIRSVNISDSGLYQLNIISGSQHNFKLTVVVSTHLNRSRKTAATLSLVPLDVSCIKGFLPQSNNMDVRHIQSSLSPHMLRGYK